MKPFIHSKKFPLHVDYEKSLAKAIHAGRYLEVDGMFDEQNFPTSRTGSGDIEMVLVSFESKVDKLSALRAIGDACFRPIVLAELLAWGETYRESFNLFVSRSVTSITALDSLWLNRHGNELAPKIIVRWQGYCDFRLTYASTRDFWKPEDCFGAVPL